jgi:hypothetical protein
MGAGSHGNGGLCGSKSASLGMGVLRGRWLRDDRAHVGGGGRLLREAARAAL